MGDPCGFVLGFPGDTGCNRAASVGADDGLGLLTPAAAVAASVRREWGDLGAPTDTLL